MNSGDIQTGAVCPTESYARYVQPGAMVVRAWLMSHGDRGRTLLWEDVLRTVYQERGHWDSLVAQYKKCLAGDVPSWGDCFSQAVVFCAVLRAIGYGQEAVLVAVTCHVGEPFERALHATVALLAEDEWYCLDITKPSIEDAIFRAGRLGDVLKTNPYVCMFNDRRWRIAEE